MYGRKLRYERRRAYERNRNFLILVSGLCLALAFAFLFGSFLSQAGAKESDTIYYKYYTNIEIQPGDTLWVRETWAKSMAGTFMYQADDKAIMVERWRPSIHMPREAARLFLRVTGVRVERLKDIDGHGILKEGIDNGKSNPAMGTRWENMQSMAFAELWNSTLKSADLPLYGWAANPWVWVIEFERISKDEALGGGGDG